MREERYNCREVEVPLYFWFGIGVEAFEDVSKEINGRPKFVGLSKRDDYLFGLSSYKHQSLGRGYMR